MEVRRSAALEEYAKEAWEAFDRGDDAWFERHTAAGNVVSFGTDPQEVYRGREAVLGLTTDQIHEMNENVGIKVERGEVEAYEAGDTGWILTHGRFVLANGTFFPTRSLTVVLREDGEWKMGIGGVSLVVRNELLTAGSPIAEGPVGVE
jgi:hypothetical protein